MLLAGLAGTTNTMVSATVYALSRLVYEYSDRVGQLAPPLLESVMLLFQQKSREVVTATPLLRARVAESLTALGADRG